MLRLERLQQKRDQHRGCKSQVTQAIIILITSRVHDGPDASKRTLTLSRLNGLPPLERRGRELRLQRSLL
jgi:hypothetical protein